METIYSLFNTKQTIKSQNHHNPPELHNMSGRYSFKTYENEPSKHKTTSQSPRNSFSRSSSLKPNKLSDQVKIDRSSSSKSQSRQRSPSPSGFRDARSRSPSPSRRNSGGTSNRKYKKALPKSTQLHKEVKRSPVKLNKKKVSPKPKTKVQAKK